MVEHNLAKVRVASSSLVFRSFFDLIIAQVAELVDAHVSGACVERHAGSSPVLGTLFVRRASFAEIAQLVRAPPCHGGGREFESLLGRSYLGS